MHGVTLETIGGGALSELADIQAVLTDWQKHGGGAKKVAHGLQQALNAANSAHAGRGRG